MIKLCRSGLIMELFGLVGIAGVTPGPFCGCVVEYWMGPWNALLAARVHVLAFQQVQNITVLNLVLR